MSNPTEEAQPSETRNVNEIKLVRYGDTFGSKVLLCEPSPADIQQALDEGRLEQRNYQTDLDTLVSEWKRATNDGQDQAEWVRQVTGYHARRVAYFVTHGWSDPIMLTADGRITDGSHRIRAAIFKGISKIEVRIAQ